jgi:hypothetical protein
LRLADKIYQRLGSVTSRQDPRLQPACRALFQLILTSSFDPCDLYGHQRLFGKLGAADKRGRVVHVCFGISPETASHQEKLQYFRSLARIVGFGFRLDELMPASLRRAGWHKPFDLVQDLPAGEHEHPNFALMRELQAPDSQVTGELRHVVLVLCAFWLVANFDVVPLTSYPVDVFGLRRLFRGDSMEDFVRAHAVKLQFRKEPRHNLS